ncbi:hypothetical protein ABZ756_02075 [Mammaliicoccus sciuri]
MKLDLFRRKIALQAGGKLIEPPLTIYFDSEFDDSEEINTTTIKVYNLTDSTIAGIKKNSPILLTAGYEGDTGVIFEGVVNKPQTTWSGVDKITEIECADQHGIYLTKQVNRTFAPGTPASVILKFLISQAGLGIGDFSLVQDFVYRRGKALKGKASTLLKQIVKDTKSKMHIKRGKIYIRPTSKGDSVGFVLNKDSGLIDSPERIESEIEDKKTKKKSTRVGWKVKMLLNHKVTVDSLLVIKSKTANGTFRVVKGRHYCDGNGFYTEVECY